MRCAIFIALLVALLVAWGAIEIAWGVVRARALRPLRRAGHRGFDPLGGAS